MEFDEARLYQAGDDIRSIDWRVTARPGKPIPRCFVKNAKGRYLFPWITALPCTLPRAAFLNRCWPPNSQVYWHGQPRIMVTGSADRYFQIALPGIKTAKRQTCRIEFFKCVGQAGRIGGQSIYPGACAGQTDPACPPRQSGLCHQRFSRHQ